MLPALQLIAVDAARRAQPARRALVAYPRDRMKNVKQPSKTCMFLLVGLWR